MNNVNFMEKLLNGVGVEWKALGDVGAILRGTAITEKETNLGAFPVVANGPCHNYYHDKSNRNGETIVIARSGAYAGLVSYWNQPIFLTDAFSIHPDNKVLSTKFLYYYFKKDQTKIHLMGKGAGVPHVRANDFESYRIPILPLGEQARIVSFLDAFTAMTAELTAELTARKKQYNYYRDQLLSFEEGEVEWRALGDLVDINTGSKPSEILEWATNFDYINAGTTRSGYSSASNCEGDTVTTPSRGQGGIGFVGYQKASFWLGPLCYKLQSIDKTILINKYLFYFLQSRSELLLGLKKEGGVPAVNKSDLVKLVIPVPSLQAQQGIVDILDKFDALTNSISEGLPREIELRQKQYEYYRDLLLSFPKPEEVAA